jgi:hypothetical protein
MEIRNRSIYMSMELSGCKYIQVKKKLRLILNISQGMLLINDAQVGEFRKLINHI